MLSVDSSATAARRGPSQDAQRGISRKKQRGHRHAREQQAHGGHVAESSGREGEPFDDAHCPDFRRDTRLREAP